MIASLSRRDRATLAIGVAAVLAILVIGKGFPALRTWERGRMAVATEARRQLTIAERGIAMLDLTRDSASAREQRLGAIQVNMVTSASPEAAAARLAALLEEIAGQEGVTVGTVTLRPDSALRSGMARVGVRMSAEGDVEGLAGLLFSIESHETPMLVREVLVSQPDPAAPQTRPEALRFDVYVMTIARVQPPGGSSARATPAPRS